MSGFFRPTIPKILIYIILFFLMPTYYYVCNDSICNLEVSFFVMASFIAGIELGTVTLPGLLLIIILSYLMACFVVRAAKPFFEAVAKKQKVRIGNQS